MRLDIRTPAWEGQNLRGSLLVWNEQGIGDEIFFAGMLGDLTPYAGKVIVCVDRRLVRLFQRSFGNLHVVSRQRLGTHMPVEAQIPMGSLGRFLRHSVNAFPVGRMPYLRACASRVRKLRANISRGDQLICGLSWLSKAPATGMDKSLRLKDLVPILAMPGVDFIDLQYGDTAHEQSELCAATGLKLQQVAEVDSFNDIDGLAALICACDLIVSVSNTTAHLAAALGKPVLLMLPFTRGLLWYWHMDHGGNPWYPSVTPFRQSLLGDWRTVIDDVGTALARHQSAHREAGRGETMETDEPT